jgi:hypothetical protein
VRIPKHAPPRNAGPALSGRAPVDPRRILASLERGGAVAAQAPASRRHLATGAATVLIALAGALGWAAYRGAAAPQIAPPQPAPEQTARQGVAAEPRRPIATANPAPAPAAAEIVNDTLAQSQLAPATPRQSWLDAVPALAPPAPPLPPPSSKSRPARPHAAQAAHSRRVVLHYPAVPTPHQPAAPAPSPTVPAPDSDVVLLTALVAHANKQAPPLAKAPAPAATDPLAGGSNRDVVLPKENESTESLLQRCKQLGFIEGMLCRSRICAGRPDSAACAQ